MIFLPVGPTVITPPHTRGVTYGQFYEVNIRNISRTPSNSLQNSEFGVRYSTLLPIGNGLQASFIYLYEFRDARA